MKKTDGETLDAVLAIVRECLADTDGNLTDGEYLAQIEDALADWENSER